MSHYREALVQYDMTQKQKIITGSILALVILFALLTPVLAPNLLKKQTPTSETPATTQTTTAIENEFLLAEFPKETVPLYKVIKISSSKFFMNNDPKNSSIFGEKNFAYFNVVFDTDASKEEFLNYYKSFFDSQITDEYPNDDMVKGTKGQYKITASHYGSGKTAYLQVYVTSEITENIRYFENMPDTLTDKTYLTEHEKSYGFLNQKGGEIEYTQYFTVSNTGDQDKDGKDDVDEFAFLEKKFITAFDKKENYEYSAKSKMMTWKEDNYSKTITFSPSHNRIYIMLRKQK